MATISGIILPDHVIGQLSGRSPIPQESLGGIRGEAFEILPLHSLRNPRFSWILMQDRAFVERTEKPLFRTIFREVGTYILNVEVTSEDGGTKIRRMFEIAVRESSTESLSENQDTLVALMPRAQEQAIALSNGKSTVLLSPTKKTRILSIESNPSLDTNGDGNPKNDNDADGSSFGTEGNPLYLWFTSPVTVHPIIVHAESGEIQEFFVASPAFLKSGEETSGNMHINAEISAERNILFTAEFAEGQKPESPFLFYWNFGDGKESLLENPTHQYGADGEYDVQLTIRDLESGVVLMNAKKKIAVQEGISGEQSTDQKTFSGRIFILGGGIVVLLVVLGGVYIVLTRFVRKKIQSPHEEESLQKPTKKPGESKEKMVKEKGVVQKMEEPEEIPRKEPEKPEESPIEDLEYEQEKHSEEKQNQEDETDELTEDVQKIMNAEEESQLSKEKSEKEIPLQDEKDTSPPVEELPPIDMAKAPAWLQKGLDVPIGSQKPMEETSPPLDAILPDTTNATTPPQPQEPSIQDFIPQEPIPTPPLTENIGEPPVPISSDIISPPSTPDAIPPIPYPELQEKASVPSPLPGPQEQVSIPLPPQEQVPPTPPPSPQPSMQPAASTSSLLPTQTPKKKRRRRRPRNRNPENGPAGGVQGTSQTQGPRMAPRSSPTPMDRPPLAPRQTESTKSSEKNISIPEKSPSPPLVTPVSPPSEEIIEKQDENEPVAFIQVDSIQNPSQSLPIQEKADTKNDEDQAQGQSKTIS